MRITATDKRLKVAYRLAGRYYNHTASEGEVFDTGDRTSFPFDEADIEVGETWELAKGATLVCVSEYLPIPGFSFELVESTN